MKCPFTVGDKVICVAPGDWKGANSRAERLGLKNYRHPERGKIYTVRTIYIDPIAKPPDNVGVLLDEILNEYVRFPDGSIHEVGFHQFDFDCVPDGKIDLSRFTKQRA